MIYRASTLSLSFYLSLCEAKWAEEGRKLRLDEIREGKRFLADRIIYATSSFFSFLLFSRNNCRDNVASVWIPQSYSLVFRVGKKKKKENDGRIV